MSQPSSGEPRVFSLTNLEFRANSASSRSARVATEGSVGAKNLLAGVFWSEPGSVGGWSFGSSDPGVEGAPWVGVGEEVYLCLQGRVHVEWEGGEFEFGAGDIVFWPNDRWFRSVVVSDEPVQMFYCMAPPPTSMWGLGGRVTKTGEAVESAS
jgi:ethanolamine utilization protein EutQ (cupin superfamily)